MKLLVTGAAGFIGANFCHYMLKKYSDYKVIGLDCLTYAGNLHSILPLKNNDNFSFCKVDIRDANKVFALMESLKPDIVINFAAESHVDRSIENPNIFVETNVLGTLNLLQASKKIGVKRFHQISTDEVYGDLPLDRKDLLFKEDTPIKPSSPYSASKASADLLVLSYFRTYNMPITLSRCSNNYGFYHFPEKLIPLAITNLFNGKKVPVYGNGLNVRDWLFVEDHASAIDAIIHNGKEGEVYNVGGNNEKANIEIVKIILKELGKDESSIEYVKDRPGHDLRYAIDSSKLKRELGWEPQTAFEEGIIRTIDWYKKNEEWWRKVLDGSYKECDF